MTFSANFAVSGVMAEYHAHRHAEKIKKHPTDCGIDLYPSDIRKLDKFAASYQFLVGTKFHLNPPVGSFGWLTDRSSSLSKLAGAHVVDGKIDAGYTGELLVRVSCPANDIVAEQVSLAISDCIENKVAIAQIIVCMFIIPNAFNIFTESGLIAPISGRGSAGFGSTDKPTTGQPQG